MVESTDQTGRHSSEPQRTDKIPSNIVHCFNHQYPQQFAVSSSGNLFGLYMNPSSMLPMDTIPLYGYSTYEKDQNDSNREHLELNDSINNLVKSDRGEMSNEGISFLT